VRLSQFRTIWQAFQRKYDNNFSMSGSVFMKYKKILSWNLILKSSPKKYRHKVVLLMDSVKKRLIKSLHLQGKMLRLRGTMLPDATKMIYRFFLDTNLTHKFNMKNWFHMMKLDTHLNLECEYMIN
jgi:hypothetical protein